LDIIEKNMGYVFRDKSLLRQALTHRSYLNENKRLKLQHNERLEFLGDMILGMIVTDYLFRLFPEKGEGELTHMRMFLVSNDLFAEMSEGLGVNNFFFMSRGESANAPARKKILANAFEALVGAVYLDGGLPEATKFVHLVLLSIMDTATLQGDLRDPKTRLQEAIQSEEKISPTYKILSTSGPDHDRTFHAAVYVGTFLAGQGSGPSRMKAERAAAKDALIKYRSEMV
jgi:ribonuclease-3